MDEARKEETRRLGKRRRMNWKNRLRRAKEDADDDDEDDDENDDYDDYEGVLNGGVAESELVFSQSFERETRCSERFPRRRGRLDKAEEAE